MSKALRQYFSGAKSQSTAKALAANKRKRSRVQKRLGEIFTEPEAMTRLKAEEEARKSKRSKGTEKNSKPKPFMTSITSLVKEKIHHPNTRGGVEDTRLQAKDTKKIRGQGQEQPFRGQNLSRPRTGMLEAKDTGASVLQKKKTLQKIFSGDLQFIGVGYPEFLFGVSPVLKL